MNNQVLKVNAVNIENNVKKINSTFDELLSMFKKFEMMIDDTVSVCDTKTAAAYRNVVQKFMEYKLANIENDFRDCVDNLSDAAKIYKQLETSINNLVNGDLK